MLVKLFFLVIFSLSFESLFVKCAEDKVCANNVDLIVEGRLATKTPYRHLQNNDVNPVVFEGCRPTKIWSLIRHGTRNPSKSNIKRMLENLVEIRDDFLDNNSSHLCAKDLEAFRSWNLQMDVKEEKILVDEGVDELFKLGQRFKARFPDLLAQKYDERSFRFKYTKTERAQRSAELFALALFGEEDANRIKYPEALSRDPVLRFYKLCERWKKEVDKNPESYREVNLFKAGEEMKKTVADISKKLATFVDADDVILMYTMCAFETSWNKTKTSPWCTLFSEESIKVTEFTEDLEYYWIDGYGYELTYKQACSAFSDLFQRFSSSSNEANVTFYFTHSGTILKSLAFLNLYKDEHLTHKDFQLDRKWRVSAIDAFASNLAFVQYDCSTGPHILLMHQERPIHIPGCPDDKKLCSFDTFTQIFKDKIENCDMNGMCSLSPIRHPEL